MVIKTLLKKLAARYYFLRYLRRGYIRVVRILLYFSSLSTEINDELIIFESYMGRGYSCSPKAIYEKLLNHPKYKHFHFVWAFRHPDDYQFLRGPRTTVVKYRSKQHLKCYASAKYWFSNSRLPSKVKRKPNQVYIQCWHGTPLKKLGHDIVKGMDHALLTNKEMARLYELEAKEVSCFLSPSSAYTKMITSAFSLNTINKQNSFIEQGYPRNDYLINHERTDVKEIKARLNIPADKKALLYAPTWRENQHQAGLGYTYRTEVDFAHLYQALHDRFVILFRPHYFVANAFDFERYAGFCYDVTAVDDINELYVISDVLVTDYSSVVFDYASLNRPIIFFMYDLEEYQKRIRGFYMNLDELPGDIVKNEDQLVKILNNLDSYDARCFSRYEKFKKRFKYLDDGGATGRTIECIFERSMSNNHRV